ncbi:MULTISPECIES: peptidoglycan-binding domain-containing protein [unclassified Bradyrhizobium]|uniref:peptidoglycan-binding domain-containing protein n=1 Tax=unclassified Bradyrhizobium TaxID=2631580 RepID=UPI0028F14C66|nr:MULTISPECIES: peptidoglycan-binding domain-containing protein [unclassified Bradyrhizobium]
MSNFQNGAVRPFQLLANPFFVLQVDPTTPLDRISEAVEDALADGEVPESAIMAAREALINPRQRTGAELSYLIDSPSSHIPRLVTALNESGPSAILKEANRTAPLSRSNLLAEISTRSPASSEVLFSIIDAHAQISSFGLLAKIQSVRRQAGIVSPSLEAVEEALSKLYEQHVKAVLAGLKNAYGAAAPLRECTTRILAVPDEDRRQALDRLLRAYAQFASSELGELEERITALVEQLRTRPATTVDIGELLDQLRRWLNLAQPLIDSEAQKGRDEARSRQLCLTIRSLCIDRANEQCDFVSALSISEVASEIFKSLPRASEQLAEDNQILKDRITEGKLAPLKKFIEAVTKWTIAADLESGGFGPSAKGAAHDLWSLFMTTSAELRGSNIADLPWILVRGLAIDLNNEENSPVAAKVIIEQLLRLSCGTSPSPDFIERLREDLRAVTKNANEKGVLKLVESGNTSAALRALDEVLKTDLSSEDRALYGQLQGKLQGQRNVRFAKWGFFGLIAAVLIGANLSNNSGPSSQRTAPPTRPVEAPLPPYQTPHPSSDIFPAPTRVSPTPWEQSDLSEVKPPIGSGSLLTRSNIRYCRFQKARLKSVEADLRSFFETEEFNKLADDYNARCASFRYYEDDLRIVEKEVEGRAAVLIQEGRSISAAWRSRAAFSTVPGPSPLPFDDKPVTSTVPTAQLPSEMLDVPAPRSDASQPDDLATNLLDLDIAIAVQRRLLALGFFRGPVNGVWGPQSRSALRAFKIANSLPPDDIYDDATAGRLNSAAAIHMPRDKPSTPVEPVQESYYAPRGGATTNPLNRSEAARIHNKLRELGYYRASNNNLWSVASRDALREFKMRNGLEANDVWDIEAEQRLMAATAPSTLADLEAAFSAVVAGAWTTDLRACQGTSGGSDALIVTITSKGAETDGARCDFQTFSGAGITWKVAAVCTMSGETRKTTIRLARSNDALTWSSAKGTTKYLRCPS